jgi:hypothetical protein
MKKLLLCALLFGILSGAVFAWEPEDLMKCPLGQEAGDFILNAGVGFDYPGTLGSGYVYIPPIRASLDYNIAIGDHALPFFAGGAFAYSGYGYKDEWFYSRISVAGRFGYHFNWDVERLDTYALTTAGWMLYAGDTKHAATTWGWPIFDIRIGARWFLVDWFGFWTEAGFGASIFTADLGIAFKF